MRCEFCGKENEEDSIFCYYCGNKLLEKKVKLSLKKPSKRICPSCKKEVNHSAKFCPFCGEKLTDLQKQVNQEQMNVIEKQEDLSSDSITLSSKQTNGLSDQLNHTKKSKIKRIVLVGSGLYVMETILIIWLVAVIGIGMNENDSEPFLDDYSIESQNWELEKELENIDSYYENFEDKTSSKSESEDFGAEQTDPSISNLTEQIDLAYDANVPSGNGRYYEMLTEYVETKGTVYSCKKGAANQVFIPRKAEKITVIGQRIYYISRVGNEPDGYATAFSVNLDGTDEKILAYHIPTNEPVFIANGSLYTQNREISLENPESDQQLDHVKKFLTFDKDSIYYISNNGEVCYSDYSFDTIRVFDTRIFADHIGWAEVFDRYFVYYDKIDQKYYGYSLDGGKKITYPIETLVTATGNAGNYHWIYGIEDAKIVKISLDGTQKKNLYLLDETNAQVIHVTSNLLFFYTQDQNRRRDYGFDLKTGKCELLYEGR